MDLFRAAHKWGAVKKAPSIPNICHTYPTMIKLCTVIPYLKKIPKICKLRDTPLEFAVISIISGKSAAFVISKTSDKDCILIHNFQLFQLNWSL